MTIEWRPIAPGDIDHELLWSGVGLAVAVLVLAGSPLIGLLHPPCVFKAVTGIPCPTCGATRAVLALLRGEWWSAVRFNPLVTLILVGWMAWIPYALGTLALGSRRLRVVCSSRDCTWLRILAVGTIAANWVFLVLDAR